MTKLKTLAVGLAVSMTALAGMSATADAHRRGLLIVGPGHHHHHHFRYRYVTPLVTTGPGCGVYWHRWKVTGNSYWKRRYWECID